MFIFLFRPFRISVRATDQLGLPSYTNWLPLSSSVFFLSFLKPAGFTLDGTVKLLDFGLAKVVEDASVDSDEVFSMSGETGSLRYMAPEVC